MSTVIINLLSQKIYVVDSINRVLSKIEVGLKDSKIDLSNAKSEVVPFDGIPDLPVVQTKLSGFEALPAKKSGTFYIVPGNIKDSLGRDDLLKVNEQANVREVYDGKETVTIDRQRNIAVKSFTV